MRKEPRLQLGDRAKDKLTGYTGIVVAITSWLNGCSRITLQSERLKDDKPSEVQSFDEGQLQLVKRGVHRPVILVEASAPDLEAGAMVSAGGPNREGPGFRRI